MIVIGARFSGLLEEAGRELLSNANERLSIHISATPRRDSQSLEQKS
jgi:hypothetical protein